MKEIFNLSKWQKLAALLAARNPRYLVLIFALLFCTAAAEAQLNLDVTTDGSGTAFYNGFNASAGPFPFSNFGVGASSTLTFGAVTFSGGIPTLVPGTQLNIAGSTQFQLPTYSPGATIAGGSTANITYTPTWTSGSITTNTTVSANAGFSYDIGPFSGSKSIYNQSFSINATGNLTNGTNLTAGTLTANGTGQSFTAGYTLSAIAASASANLVAGANLSSSLTYNPNAGFGYVSWISTTAGGTPTQVQVHLDSGSGLQYTFTNLGIANNESFYLNFLPIVGFDLNAAPTANFSVPISGSLSAEALGQTLASYTFPIGTLLSEDDTANNADFTFDWAASSYESIPLTITNANTNFYSFVVGGDPFFEANTFFPGSSNSNFTNLGAIGGFAPGDSNQPNLPPACDFSGLIPVCYASNDPNMPTGPGTVSFTSAPVGSATPEPGSLLLLGSGLLGAGFLIRRHRS